MKTIFKVGDKVFDIRYRWGVVESISPLIKVNFEKGLSRSYYGDGKYYDTDLVPALSFTEYTLQGFSQERPKKKPEIGSLCLFSDFKELIDANIGVVRLLADIKDGIYKATDGNEYKFCKQIEIKDV